MNIANKVLELSDEVGSRRELSGLESVPIGWNGNEGLLVYFEDCPLYYQHRLAGLTPHSATVLSMHKSETKIPCLTVHCTGNIGEAKYGGSSRNISIAPAARMRAALSELMHQAESSDLRYSVSYEVTHHGPTVDYPIMFLEIGSSEDNWTDVAAGEAVARAALVATSRINLAVDTYIGLGGPHYAPLFTSRAVAEGTCLGHMVSRHQLHDLDREMLTALTERNVGVFKGAIVDWKGLKEERRRIASLLDEMHVRYVRI